jgi:hypothetical protein
LKKFKHSFYIFSNILKYNNQAEARGAGVYRFRFYRMGEWMDVIIDDYLPKKQHAKVKNNEYWVPLVEKAYAKFFGSYKMLIGGNGFHTFRKMLEKFLHS